MMLELLTMTQPPTTYPRRLRPKEWDLLETVLPADRPGYKEYRDLVSSMVVLAQGRRGKGNLVLGFEDDIADTSSPLPPVVAYGMVETTGETFSITVREYVAGQIDVEIVSSHGEEIPDHFEEKRRWTYSTWSPGSRSPALRLPVREVRVDDNIVLALSREEQRLWLHDGRTGMNHLLPITNFHNELMLHKGIRDPKIALKSGLLFEQLDSYSDDDLRTALIAYNKFKQRVAIAPPPPAPQPRGWRRFLQRLSGGHNA